MKTVDYDQPLTLPEPRTEIDRLHFDLASAASDWYKTQDHKYIDSYLRIYEKLRAMGWNGAIDVDAHLPDEHMPSDYLARVAKATRPTRTKRPEGFATLALVVAAIGFISQVARRFAQRPRAS
jgi:hypothetical protein